MELTWYFIYLRGWGRRCFHLLANGLDLTQHSLHSIVTFGDLKSLL